MEKITLPSTAYITSFLWQEQLYYYIALIRAYQITLLLIRAYQIIKPNIFAFNNLLNLKKHKSNIITDSKHLMKTTTLDIISQGEKIIKSSFSTSLIIEQVNLIVDME